MDYRLVEQLQKLVERSSVHELFPDMWNLFKMYDHEELWLYFLKNGKVLNKERYVWSVGKDWAEVGGQDYKPNPMQHASKNGVELDKEELFSAAKGEGADEVIMLHNHPVENDESIFSYSNLSQLRPTPPDIKSSQNIDNYSKSFGFKSRFFIICSPIKSRFDPNGEYPPPVIEFATNGQVIRGDVSADRFKYLGRGTPQRDYKQWEKPKEVKNANELQPAQVS